ncbi:hypothetical protein BDF21DRAFT_428640 [Thamnidium elegans]|nr:hypothetical protein BDF21DRAFT_428640 [Thamnidium elegans]
MSSKAFFFVRLILALYSTIVFWAYFVVMIQLDRFAGFFKAFTTMTFVGLHAYLVISSIYHYRYLRSKSIDVILQQHPCLNYMYLYLYSTVITFNVLTPVIFWSILSRMQSNADPVVAWINVSVHGASFFLMFIDVVLNRIVLPIRLVLFVFFTTVLYLLLAIIIYTW